MTRFLPPEQIEARILRPKPHIPERHAVTILTHLVRNFQNEPGPLMLGIDGPPGTGKTFGVTETLNRAGVARVTLSGADLESPEAGQPARTFRRAYVTAASVLQRGKPAAVFLDDLDVTLGRWDETSYTVNNQLVGSELMHLADLPTRVDGRTVRRVPIIITGNHLARLYEPLRRPGRMQIHPWTLEPGERVEVIQGIFHGFDPDIVLELITQFSHQSVAFFADLRRRAEEDRLRSTIRGLDPAEAVRKAVNGELSVVRRGRIDTAKLLALGRRLQTEHTCRNHLGE